MDMISFEVIGNIMSGLTQYSNSAESTVGSKLTCQAACAKSWEVLDGGTRYVFHLRDDIFWSDGKKLTAKDFEYAWQRLIDPVTGAAYAHFLYDVTNAREINQGQIKDLNQLGAKALDDLTFEVRLNKPAAYFIYLTAGPTTYPLRKDIVDAHPGRWTEPSNIVTNGAFKLDSWQHEYKIDLVANDKFFLGRPKIDKIKMFMIPEQSTAFSLYQNDQLDFIDNRSFTTSDIEQCKKDPNFKTQALLRAQYLGLNTKKAPLDDVRVRKAFSMAIDKSIFPKILRRQETPMSSWVPPVLIGYEPDSGLKFDPVQARKLLAEAGYPDGKNFPKTEVLYVSREDTKLGLEAIQAELKKNLGVRIELVNQEFKVYLTTRKMHPPQVIRASWSADFPDTDNFMNVFTSESGNNYTGFKNKEYDKCVEDARGELDSVKRANLYSRADKLLCKENAVLIPLYMATQCVLYKPWVHGIDVNALDIQNYRTAYLEGSN
ncbi:peptide ABC transporter substrate-binding protein [bacterium]|nr:peptide ABC transporter substrate-binding protein [bacterium]